MTSALTRFQDGFAQALLAPQTDAIADATPEIAALVSQPGFAVYRNTVMKGCIDALQANYPSITRLVGKEWFRAAAAIFVRENLPVRPTLAYYGEGFAGFLERFEPAAELPYLPGVARIERFWTEAHAAPDEALLDPAAISSLTPDALAESVLHPHAAARWAWFAGQPIYTIWQRNREALDEDDEIDWHGEGALLTRPHGAVKWMQLDAAGCAFLDRCARGRPLAEAAGAALEPKGNTGLERLMASLLEAGAFSRIGRPDNDTPGENDS